MRTHTLMWSLVVLAGGCDPASGEPGPSFDAADADADTDSGEEFPDGDKDGYPFDEDCNDASYQDYPGAPELCDGRDNDCDGLVDEDFDVDADGALDMTLCEDGTDCDDHAGGTFPGAAEIPCDGIDQDCSGADLTDADGDRYECEEVGGFDCDDTDPDVNPGAEEVPKNGKDDDCDGEDSADGDLDGYVDADFGGDDCDDADPSVHPGAWDPWNDGFDSDCDDEDSTPKALADLRVTIDADSSDTQALVGEAVAICDLDGDGLGDLVVAAPFAAAYAGQVGIFYGDGAEGWSGGMTMSDADTLIESADLFLGFGIACGDFDGDGTQDLVTARGEIEYSTYVTQFELVVFYGTGAKLGAEVSELDADARLFMSMGAPRDTPSVYSREYWLLDRDDDGMAELWVEDSVRADLDDPDGVTYVLPGGRYDGESEFLDEDVVALSGEDGAATPGRPALLPDLDGDGTAEIALAEPGWNDDSGDAYDTGMAYDGRVGAVPADFEDGDTTDAVGIAQLIGEADTRLGFAMVAADVTGNGVADLVVSAPWTDGDEEDAGAVLLLPDASASWLGSFEVGALSLATIQGATESGLFGYRLVALSDLDGDGTREIFVGEPLGADGAGAAWIVRGSSLAAGGNLADAAYICLEGEEDGSIAGATIAAGDIDGDGIDDLVVGAQNLGGSGAEAGKVYVALSSKER